MQVDDWTQVQIIVPGDQSVISYSSEASTLAEKKNHAVLIENLFRFT